MNGAQYIALSVAIMLLLTMVGSLLGGVATRSRGRG